MHHIAINAHDAWDPHMMNMFIIMFNCSHLVVVVCMLFKTQQRLQYRLPKANLSSTRCGIYTTWIVEYQVF